MANSHRIASLGLLPGGALCLTNLATRRDTRRERTRERPTGKAARHESVHAVRARDHAAPREEKRRIVEEFVALTGYHRKHAIRVLTAAEPAAPRGSPARPRRYDDEVRQALVTLWETSDRLCGKRLKASLPLLVEALERHGHLALGEHVRARLLAVSASTAKELLARLPQEHLGTFPDGQLRTLQRRVQAWRATEARRLLPSSLDGIGAVHREPTAVEP
jgi:hypothetical protein